MVNEYAAQYRVSAMPIEGSFFSKEKITNSEDCEKILRSMFRTDEITIFETMVILCLDRANQTIGWAKISQGGIAGTIVSPQIVAKYAVDLLASSIILCHNHPSGTLKASNEDINISKKIKNGLEFFDVKLLDHIILTKDSYLSMADEGLI